MTRPASMRQERHATRSALGTAVLLAAGLGLAAPAAGTDVGVAGSTLTVDAPGHGANVIDVRVVGPAYVVDDALADIVPGAGCGSLDVRRVICAGSIQSVDVRGHGGNDFIGLWDVPVPARVDGGSGDDLLETGNGRDDVLGGRGDDAIVGGVGDDAVRGESGDDLLEGGAGSDVLLAGDDDDILEAGDSSGDLLQGGLGQDLLHAGDRGGAVLDAGAGADVLVARGGSNVLVPGIGADTVLGVTAPAPALPAPVSPGLPAPSPAPSPAPRSPAGADRVADVVSCTPGDRARTRGGGTVDACGAVPTTTTVPERWPPRSRSARAAALPGGHPEVIVRPRARGDAARFTVRVRARRTGKRKVCVRLYDERESLVARFTKEVRLKYATTYATPRIPRGSHYGRPYRGRCK